MDARRQPTYTGLYDFTDGRINTILPQCVVMIEEIVDQINELGRMVIFLGVVSLHDILSLLPSLQT